MRIRQTMKRLRAAFQETLDIIKNGEQVPTAMLHQGKLVTAMKELAEQSVATLDKALEVPAETKYFIVFWDLNGPELCMQEDSDSAQLYDTAKEAFAAARGESLLMQHGFSVYPWRRR